MPQMVTLDRVRADLALPLAQRPEYRVLAGLFVFQSAASTPNLKALSTQAAVDRQVWFRDFDPAAGAIEVGLAEDDYRGWLPVNDLFHLEPAAAAYRAPQVDHAAVERAIPGAIAFAQAARARPHRYLWGACLGPDYDCSGIVQAAFAAEGVWLPRDSFLQEAFCVPIAQDDLQAGDLIFFGVVPERANHVALCLGRDAVGIPQYLHCCGYDQGRGGMAVEPLAAVGDRVTRTYFSQLRGFGRIPGGYQPGDRA